MRFTNMVIHRWETSCGMHSHMPKWHYGTCPQCGKEVVYGG